MTGAWPGLRDLPDTVIAPLPGFGDGKFREKRQIGPDSDSQTILRPTDVVPSHYDVTLFPDVYGGSVSQFEISGLVSCEFSVARETRTVLLHADNQTILNWRVADVTADRHLDVGYAGATDTDITFQTSENLLPNRAYHLTFDFRHVFRSAFFGLFLNSVQAENNSVQ